ncbi:MAG: ABC transporter substrate-binding protein [Thiolinea sp.]
MKQLKQLFSKVQLSVAVATLTAGMVSPSFAEDVEVMHWWTSGGEAEAISVLKKALEGEGVGWNDAAVAGGGGTAAMTALKARVTSGNPPTAAQIGLMGLQEWAGEGLLGDLSAAADKQGWAKDLPPAVMEGAKHEGKFVGVPFNIHRANWLWSNAKIFADNGLTPPTTWDEFFAVGDKLKGKGIIPLALGGEPWQETILLEDTVTAVGGADFYRKAFLELDMAALGSEQMVKAFEVLGKIRDYIDPGAPGRAWNDATSMVLTGKAAMQLMGDWAKGEIVKAKLVPGKDILCTPAPGTAGAYHFNVDYFMMFKAEGSKLDAQMKLAAAIMNPSFQETFNIVKGSIPANTAVKGDKFDVCAQQAMKDIQESVAKNALIGALQGGAAQPGRIQGAVQDVVANFFSSSQSAKDAVAALVKAVADAKS